MSGIVEKCRNNNNKNNKNKNTPKNTKNNKKAGKVLIKTSLAFVKKMRWVCFKKCGGFALKMVKFLFKYNVEKCRNNNNKKQTKVFLSKNKSAQKWCIKIHKKE